MRTACSALSSACIALPNFPAPGSAWQSSSALSCGTAENSGPRRRKARERRSFSVSRNRTMDHASKTILLVEDNPDDEKLTLRAFKRHHMLNPIDVVRDGVDALDYLFARGTYAGRVGKAVPALIVPDLKTPRLGGL